jgi:hypothetical protein
LTHRGSEKYVKKAGPNRLREKRRRRPAALAVVAPLFWLALTLLASCSLVETGQLPAGGREAPEAQAQATPASRMQEQALKDTAWDPAWPPLPRAGKPAKPIEQVRAMYAFAARHPEVLQYAPCYCGCEIGGHKNVRDCFVRGRDADGLPQWDGMGFT